MQEMMALSVILFVSILANIIRKWNIFIALVYLFYSKKRIYLSYKTKLIIVRSLYHRKYSLNLPPIFYLLFRF